MTASVKTVNQDVTNVVILKGLAIPKIPTTYLHINFGRAFAGNIERFPVDFMFELTKQELENWRCQFGTSNSEKIGFEVKEPRATYGKRTKGSRKKK